MKTQNAENNLELLDVFGVIYLMDFLANALKNSLNWD